MAKPAVDGLERKLAGRVKVARVDITSDGGSVIARKFAIDRVPAWILIDGAGRVVFRQVGGYPNVDEIVQKASAQ